MKQIFFALALLPILAFVGCSSDDDDNNTPNVDFDYSIEMLYGEWRATAVEGVGEEAIDLTNPTIEALVAPTYVTFKKEGVYSSKGILGEGAGKYITKGKTITASLGEDKVSFDMTSLAAETAKIELDASALGLPMIPDEIGKVTVVLTKQEKE